MIRFYTLMATKRKQWSYESMKAAVDHVQSQGASLRESSGLYNVPLETLRRVNEL